MEHSAELYRRYLAGDDGGMAELVETYKDGLILYLNGYVKNLHLAEDLTEETFFRLMVKKPRFSGKSSFKSWLYSIGRNVAVDFLRRNAKILPTPVEDMADYLQEEASLEQSYLQEEEKILLYRALFQLNADYRNILWLIYLEGFSHEEAATALKKNGRQVKNLLYRAKQSLKTTLEKEGFLYEK